MTTRFHESSVGCLSIRTGKRFFHFSLRGGFTLVEIMMVVAAIGILAAIAIPTFTKARLLSRSAAQMNDLRVIEDAFQRYTTDKSVFPSIPGDSSLPPGMGTYLYAKIWTQKSPAGATYTWAKYSFPAKPNAYVIVLAQANPEVMDLVDHNMDDGNPASGSLRFVSPNYLFILDQ